MKARESKLFTFIEMIVVVVVILILIGLSLRIFRVARVKSNIAATVQNLETLNTSVASYKLDFGVIPLASTVDPKMYLDPSGAVPYWNRIDAFYKKLNTIDNDQFNARIRYDDNSDLQGEIKSNHEFNSKYPVTDFRVPLDSWNIADENMEKISVLSHSSRFLNYYLSGTYLDIAKKHKYFEGNETLLGNDDSGFRYYKDDSILFIPYLYFKTEETKLFSMVNARLSEVPTVISKLPGGNNIVYTDYIYKSNDNLTEENKRRLYVMNDNAEVVSVSGDPAPKISLPSDVVVFRALGTSGGVHYWTPSSTRAQKVQSVKLHMRAHTKNVKLIVDRFNSPIVYITFSNQLKSSARTYKDPAGDYSIDNNRFIIYSLGPNKKDDTNLGENNLRSMDNLGDDLISSHGKSNSK